MKPVVFEGMKVRYRPRPDWGAGHLLSLDHSSSKACILFPERGEPVIVSVKDDALERSHFEPGDTVMLEGAEGSFSVVERVERSPGSPYARYRVHGGEAPFEVSEADLRAAPPSPDLIDSLRAGRVGDARSFILRKEALRLDDERRSDALGALFASRVMPLPYQVGVVQRVLSSARPRFVLADEVGLGKTIEAGMIFSALRLSGLARRVLVVAPTHLTVQWLVELAHKFNRLFTLMDGDRYAKERSISLDRSPWAAHDLVVTSIELLSRDQRHRDEIASAEAAWDLVIIDEAHHLRATRAYEAARGLASNCAALLLLTATPMKLDPEEYHRLLSLIEPSGEVSLEDLKRRMARQEEISAAARELMERGCGAGAIDTLASLFPGDPLLQAERGSTKKSDTSSGLEENLLQHIAETYSLSDHLIRNRRVSVGGFTKRRLHRHSLALPESERTARAAVLDHLREHKSLQGAVLARLLRQLDSSTIAFERSLASHKELEHLASEHGLAHRDTKALRFLDVLFRIKKDEPKTKILVFTESRATLEWLVLLLGEEGIFALGYHGDLGLVERDRHVARFRDPDGPTVLVSTEVGGEGRNFQFCHHLIHYDLPWSPSAVEQRIGRLDRIGQIHPVEIHVFEPEGSLAADVVAILDQAVGVFEETIGGLDAVLEEVEPRLMELAMKPAEARTSYADELAARVREARAQVRRSHDPLLDLRSADRSAVAALARRASVRLGLIDEHDEDGARGGESCGLNDASAPEDSGVRDMLWGIARDLDERLEENVTEIAERIGIGVDLDEQVEAFQCVFHFGHALKVDALPGLDITEERTLLGTFWRDTAIQDEEIDYFATGHPLVEALLGFLRDGPFGRAAFRVVGQGVRPALGMELIFHLEDPRPDDVDAGARYPARQLARFMDERLVRVVVSLDPRGNPSVWSPDSRAGLPPASSKLVERLDSEEGRTLRGDEIGLVFPGFADFVPKAVAAAEAKSLEILHQRTIAARASLDAELSSTLRRMELSMGHQDLPAYLREERLRALRGHYECIGDALDELRPVLDSACGFAIFD